jgi:hypothetical protein
MSKGKVLAMMAGQDRGVKGAEEGIVVLQSAHGGCARRMAVQMGTRRTPFPRYRIDRIRGVRNSVE